MGPVSTGALYGCAVGPLVEAGYRVVAPDLPGYGLDPPLPPEEYDVERLAGRVWRWADALGADRCDAGRPQLGGAIAVRMHALAPERVGALVLVDSGHVEYGELTPTPPPPSSSGYGARGERRLVVPDRTALAEALEVPATTPATTSSWGRSRPTRGWSRGSAPRPRAALHHLARARQSATWPALEVAGTPTLLLLATEPGVRPRAERAGRAGLRGGRAAGRHPAGRGRDAQPGRRSARGVRPHRRGLAARDDVEVSTRSRGQLHDQPDDAARAGWKASCGEEVRRAESDAGGVVRLLAASLGGIVDVRRGASRCWRHRPRRAHPQLPLRQRHQHGRPRVRRRR